ncbi:hypothetical protein AX768_18205 [Burkholderia sp. PAMC 28687]|nr:hypothetical protein AXG89_34310 [Burkholderia sp. PAMC 26561]AMM16148.1 hypothetical protein AX768_18205 [Burkholderia sp. PAMC 28687]
MAFSTDCTKSDDSVGSLAFSSPETASGALDLRRLVGGADLTFLFSASVRHGLALSHVAVQVSE